MDCMLEQAAYLSHRGGHCFHKGCRKDLKVAVVGPSSSSSAAGAAAAGAAAAVT